MKKAASQVLVPSEIFVQFVAMLKREYKFNNWSSYKSLWWPPYVNAGTGNPGYTRYGYAYGMSRETLQMLLAEIALWNVTTNVDLSLEKLLQKEHLFVELFLLRAQLIWDDYTTLTVALELCCHKDIVALPRVLRKSYEDYKQEFYLTRFNTIGVKWEYHTVHH